MRCEMNECRNKAKLQVSFSYGEAFCYCFRHTWKFVRSLIPKVATSRYGIFIQQIPQGLPFHEPSPEARPYITTPEDRVEKSTKVNADPAWEWD
jgi:hypothetical protein